MRSLLCVQQAQLAPAEAMAEPAEAEAAALRMESQNPQVHEAGWSGGGVGGKSSGCGDCGGAAAITIERLLPGQSKAF